MSPRPSVQAQHVDLEAIDEGLVQLTGGRHRAVLEVSGLNFGLLGENEQEAVIAGYAAFLNGLTFPTQVLVRVLPLNLEVYLAHLEQQALAQSSDQVIALARDHMGFLRRLARNRTLLERRFFVVVPADENPPDGRRLWPFATCHTVDRGVDARRQLTFRCEEVARQLGRCGLSARRLAGAELARLYFACWCPELARLQRLERELEQYTGPVMQTGRATERSV
ncbi:MAG: hypothetical protein M1401_00540 [Chloroflexi bacterium]|nr:hypothetical protein [Chloroflexota bacterium]